MRDQSKEMAYLGHVKSHQARPPVLVGASTPGFAALALEMQDFLVVLGEEHVFCLFFALLSRN